MPKEDQSTSYHYFENVLFSSIVYKKCFQLRLDLAHLLAGLGARRQQLSQIWMIPPMFVRDVYLKLFVS